MADDINEQSGGTQEEPKSYSESDLKSLLEKAKADGQKEGQSEAHKHWQSVSDKHIADLETKYKGKLSEYEKSVEELRQEKLKAMTPEERQATMLEAVYNKVFSTEPKNSDKPDTASPADAPADDFGKPDNAQAEIGSILKEMGLDDSKVNWKTGNMKEFLGSIVEQVKGSAKTEDTTEDDTEANRVSTSRTVSGVVDITKVNPFDLIKQGLTESKPARYIGR